MSMMQSSGMERRVRKSADRVGYPIEVFDKSRTQQAFVEECDINNIVKRNPDVLAMGTRDRPMFGEFSNLPSYHEALNLVVEARAAFDALPSEIRTRFGNDPAAFLAFMDDDANYDEAVRLGIVQPKAADPVEPSPAPTAPSPQEGE